nr:MAG TPA: minor structural protein [Bacteriophage sp.]
MYRPISLNENVYSFTLMKNRHEEWGEIPKEYVQSVVYSQGTPTQMNIEIPSKIIYMNKQIDFELYSAIRGKMQIIMELNGEKSRFIIDDNIKTKSTKQGKTKTLVAYSFEKTLDKKNFIISEGATRQLYRPKNEQVEISDGILNWFEEQTNFTVGHVDELARKEMGLYNETETLELITNHTVEQVEKNGLLWSKTMSLDVGDRPLTFTIVYTDMKSYNGDLLQKKETISHTFTNLPYGIKKIEARYSSDVDYRYGITYNITYLNDTKQEFKFGFANTHQLRVFFPKIELTYETGRMSKHLTTKYRYFEANSASWTTIMGLVEEAFDCVCVYDSYNQVLNVYDKNSFGEETGIVLNYDNAIAQIEETHKLENVVTRLYVESPNVSIVEENPLGTEYVEDFSYYIENDIMSQSLTKALIEYNKLVDEKNVEFMQLKLDKNSNDQMITKRQAELSSLQGRYKAENAILTGYIKAGDQPQKQKEQSLIVTQLEKDIEQMMNTIQTLKDRSDSLFAQMTQIGIDIQKENAFYNGAKIFTSQDLEELEDYIIESSITNDYYTLAYSLYQHALEVIADMNKVYVDFSMTTYEFLSKIKTPDAWNNHIKIGIKLDLDVEDTSIADDEGKLQLYGFTFKPNQTEHGSVSDLKFTNNKKPKATSIKTIGDISKKTSQLTTMTNFWKDTWADSASNNVAVEKLLTEGLDAAAQVVRGKGTSNKIDISEAGIYISDAEDENKQIYYGSGLISITQDKWKTSTLAIDSSGIMAETIIGKMILGSKLQIGNEDNTFEINPHGLSIYDPSAKQEERIFLGIENGKATFRLHSKNGDNKLVLSEDGIYQVFPIQARDSFDYQNSFRVSFYLPNSLQRMDEARLIFNLEKFRAYSKGAKAQEANVLSTTTETTGGITQSTKDGGAVSKTITSTSVPKTTSSTTSESGGGTTVSTTSGGGGATSTTSGQNSKYPTLVYTHLTKAGSGNHDHSISTSSFEHTHTFTPRSHTHQVNITVPSHRHTVNVTVPSHSHDVTYNIPAHSHQIDVSGHSHTVNVTVPSHSHEIIHGIYDYSKLAKCNIYIDGVLVLENVAGDRDINIVQYIKKNADGNYGGTHTLEVRSVSTDSNPQGLGRANVSIFISGFVSF